MRKIDTEAYNKRLHTEIMELDKLIKSINPENVNKIDAGLIKTADEYIRLISDTTWADNSNFNGIEMHKVKDLLSYMKTRRKKLYVKRQLFDMRDDTTPETATGIATIKIPDLFDGRNSFVHYVIRGLDSEGNKFVQKKDKIYFDFFRINIRKNKSSISIEYSADLGYTYEWLRLDIFYILWR